MIEFATLNKEMLVRISVKAVIFITVYSFEFETVDWKKKMLGSITPAFFFQSTFSQDTKNSQSYSERYKTIWFLLLRMILFVLWTYDGTSQTAP